MFLLVVLGCRCGSTEYNNAGELSATGGEECGPSLGSWASQSDDGATIYLWLDAEVGNDVWPWEIRGGFAADQLREGTVLSAEDGTLSAATCYLSTEGCTLSAGLTSGTLEIGDTLLDDDPCDPFAEWYTTMTWDLEFGDPEGQDHWARSSGSDHVPLFIDHLCVGG